VEAIFDADNSKRWVLEDVQQQWQRKQAKYDRDGDSHYDLISALHKSIRSSDADASVYWLARMLEVN